MLWSGNLKKKLLSVNKISILLLAFMMLMVTPAYAVQIPSEQQRISDNRNISDHYNINKGVEECQNQSIPKTTQLTKKFKSQNKKIKEISYVNNVNPENLDINSSSIDKCDLTKLEMLKNNSAKIQKEIESKINVLSNKLDEIDSKHDKIDDNYNNASDHEIQLKNELDNYVTSTKNPNKYFELENRYKSAQENTNKLFNDLNILKTEKLAKINEISFYKNSLNKLEPIKNLNVKTSHEEIQKSTETHKENINILIKLNHQNTELNNSKITENVSDKSTTSPVTTTNESKYNIINPKRDLYTLSYNYEKILIGTSGVTTVTGLSGLYFGLFWLLKNYKPLPFISRNVAVVHKSLEIAIFEKASLKHRLAAAAKEEERIGNLLIDRIIENEEKELAGLEVKALDLYKLKSLEKLYGDIVIQKMEVEEASSLAGSLVVATEELELDIAAGPTIGITSSYTIIAVSTILLVVTFAIVIAYLGFHFGWWRSLFGRK